MKNTYNNLTEAQKDALSAIIRMAKVKPGSVPLFILFQNHKEMMLEAVPIGDHMNYDLIKKMCAWIANPNTEGFEKIIHSDHK